MKHQWAILTTSKLRDRWLKEKCLQITYSSLQKRSPVWGSSVDEIILKANPDVTHVTIVKMGCHIDDTSAYEKSTLTINGIHGQLLDFDGEYPFFHDQLIVLNLDYWRSIGAPSFEEETVPHSLLNYHPSDDKWHDHYTPKLLKKTSGYVERIPRFGSKVISSILKKDGFCKGLNEDLRNAKLYLYPHHGDEENLKSCWKNLSFENLENENHRRFFQIYFKPQYHQKSFWPYNTEKPIVQTSTTLNDATRAISPASGFLVEDVIIEGQLPAISQICFYDINSVQLNFKRQLINASKPITDYSAFVESYILKNAIPRSSRYVNVDTEQLTKIKDRLPEYYKLWRSMIQVDYKEIDLISNPAELEGKKFENCLFHFSNIYLFVWNHIKYSYSEIFKSSEFLVNKLQEQRGSMVGEILDARDLNIWKSMLRETVD